MMQPSISVYIYVFYILLVPFALEAEEPIKRGAEFSLEEEFRRQLRKIDKFILENLIPRLFQILKIEF